MTGSVNSPDPPGSTPPIGPSTATTCSRPRAGGVNELMLPAEVIHCPDLSLLGTGKTDYPSMKIVTGYLAACRSLGLT